MTGFVALIACSVLAQEFPIVSAENIAALRPVQHIDFAEISESLAIGWFEANDDASEFIVFDDSGRIFRIDSSGAVESWTYREREEQIFSLIDTVYLHGKAHILYLLDDEFFINERRLVGEYVPLWLHAFDESLFVEARGKQGAAVFQEFALDDESANMRFLRAVSLPRPENEAPAVRMGRIDFPHVILSYLSDGGLTAYRFPDSFSAESGRSFDFAGGPAVFGAINAAGSRLAWSDPASARLNLLDLATGENVVVAELAGAYAQYHLLTADASAILIVNLDFAPSIFAWDVGTGKRYDLGAYRMCERIPDKVAFSADGRALIIGCDTGLEIWRVLNTEEA